MIVFLYNTPVAGDRLVSSVVYPPKTVCLTLEPGEECGTRIGDLTSLPPTQDVHRRDFDLRGIKYVWVGFGCPVSGWFLPGRVNMCFRSKGFQYESPGILFSK